MELSPCEWWPLPSAVAICTPEEDRWFDEFKVYFSLRYADPEMACPRHDCLMIVAQRGADIMADDGFEDMVPCGDPICVCPYWPLCREYHLYPHEKTDEKPGIEGWLTDDQEKKSQKLPEEFFHQLRTRRDPNPAELFVGNLHPEVCNEEVIQDARDQLCLDKTESLVFSDDPQIDIVMHKNPHPVPSAPNQDDIGHRFEEIPALLPALDYDDRGEVKGGSYNEYGNECPQGIELPMCLIYPLFSWADFVQLWKTLEIIYEIIRTYYQDLEQLYRIVHALEWVQKSGREKDLTRSVICQDWITWNHEMRMFLENQDDWVTGLLQQYDGFSRKLMDRDIACLEEFLTPCVIKILRGIQEGVPSGHHPILKVCRRHFREYLKG